MVITNKRSVHVILDLDETLINSTSAFHKNKTYDAKRCAKFELLNSKGTEIELDVYMRPHLNEFLSWLCKNFIVSVWSAGEKNYVLDIVEKILPTNPHAIFWREHCKDCERDTGRLKDIEWLKRKVPDLTRDNEIVVMVDDLKENCVNNAWSYNISEFDVSNKDACIDNELHQLQSYLMLIKNASEQSDQEMSKLRKTEKSFCSASRPNAVSGSHGKSIMIAIINN